MVGSLHEHLTGRHSVLGSLTGFCALRLSLGLFGEVFNYYEPVLTIK
jgi:hypothetical protein